VWVQNIIVDAESSWKELPIFIIQQIGKNKKPDERVRAYLVFDA
jgi:hypothetical protein